MSTHVPEKVFDILTWAEDYAKRHQSLDAGIEHAYFFPARPDLRLIRLLYVNNQITERMADPYEPFSFGVHTEGSDDHEVQIIDVTPHQWERILTGEITLPEGWVLETKQDLL
jgi:hypothetical protein